MATLDEATTALGSGWSDRREPRLDTSLADVVDVFSRWLHLPNPGALLAMLGTIAANRLEGDPVWLQLVGPPGGGKSEMLTAVSGLADAHPCATLTEAALLSGTPKREKATGAKGGLLRQIGDFGILVCKDFGSVLSMNRDARGLVLAALREVYDGAWTRHVGTDGGQTLSWRGKVGFVGGCTPTIDRHHAVMGTMGERFVLYRLTTVDAAEHARRALGHAGRERAMRAELALVVAELFESGLRDPQPLSAGETDRLIALSTLVVRCRSAVERDSFSREIELVPEAEAPGRLALVLDRLLAGLTAIGADRATAWRVVAKAALDSVPALRLAVLLELYASGLPVETSTLGKALGYPSTTIRRAGEDLTAHGLVERESPGAPKPDRWSLTDFARTGFAEILNVPETSDDVHRRSVGGPISLPLRVYDDISGTFKEGAS